MWIPGHSDIAGHDRADKLANEATLLQNIEGTPSVVDFRNFHKKVFFSILQKNGTSSRELINLNHICHFFVCIKIYILLNADLSVKLLEPSQDTHILPNHILSEMNPLRNAPYAIT